MRLALIVVAAVALGLSSTSAQCFDQHSGPTVDRVLLEQNAIALAEEIEALQSDLKTVVEEADGDNDMAGAKVEALIAAFQPQLDSFVDLYIRFYDAMLGRTSDENTRGSLLSARDESVLALRTMPDTLRQQALTP